MALHPLCTFSSSPSRRLRYSIATEATIERVEKPSRWRINLDCVYANSGLPGQSLSTGCYNRLERGRRSKSPPSSLSGTMERGHWRNPGHSGILSFAVPLDPIFYILRICSSVVLLLQRNIYFILWVYSLSISVSWNINVYNRHMIATSLRVRCNKKVRYFSMNHREIKSQVYFRSQSDQLWFF